MSTASRTPAWLAIGGAVATLPLAFALSACSSAGPTPAATATANSTASAAQAAATAAGTQGQTSASSSSVKVPRYVAADNARKNVVTTGCVQDGKEGWKLTGTATNSGSAARTYSIVVDFVTPAGDTVVDTKVVHVGPVQPKATEHWSTTGAVGAGQAVCVIRQALAGS